MSRARVLRMAKLFRGSNFCARASIAISICRCCCGGSGSGGSPIRSRPRPVARLLVRSELGKLQRSTLRLLPMASTLPLVASRSVEMSVEAASSPALAPSRPLPPLLPLPLPPPLPPPPSPPFHLSLAPARLWLKPSATPSSPLKSRRSICFRASSYDSPSIGVCWVGSLW